MAKNASKKSKAKVANPKKAVSRKKSGKTGSKKKNKLGVKNSLVNNINAKKERGTSKSRKRSTVSKKSYDKMENNWGKKVKG